MMPNPFPPTAALQFSFTSHCIFPRPQLLLVHQLPWTRVAFCMKSESAFRIIMLSQPKIEV